MWSSAGSGLVMGVARAKELMRPVAKIRMEVNCISSCIRGEIGREKGTQECFGLLKLDWTCLLI
jgi:hypothetical protein